MSDGRLAAAARRIERWLLGSDLQIPAGPHAGGIAGWLEADGRPAFVYPEITGYFLTHAAWLAAGAASDPGRAEQALGRGREALGWLHRGTRAGALPPTRIHLLGDVEEWRNCCAFTFDLAMAARGADCFGARSEPGVAAEVVAALAGRLRELADGTVPLPSHAQLGKEPPPRRWSTEPGVHHLKAAAALLRLPPGVLGPELTAACERTVAYWRELLARDEPRGGALHPFLYGLEGLLLTGDGPSLEVAAAAFERLLALQEPGGGLPDGRSDVVAQALRVGGLLRASGRPAASQRRLDALAAVLLEHVQEDGAVRFSLEQARANVWCALFAHQALVLHAEPDSAGADLLV